MIAQWPQYWFRGEELRLIKEGEEIPAGWTDHPTPFNGAHPSHFDHDKNGEPGGSFPAAPQPKRRGRPPKVKPQDGV